MYHFMDLTHRHTPALFWTPQTCREHILAPCYPFHLPPVLNWDLAYHIFISHHPTPSAVVNPPLLAAGCPGDTSAFSLLDYIECNESLIKWA